MRGSSEAAVYVETGAEFRQAVAQLKKPNCHQQRNQTKRLQTDIQKKD